jgi:hypothetical protein
MIKKIALKFPGGGNISHPPPPAKTADIIWWKNRKREIEKRGKT